jgi:arsenate reductase
MADTERLEIFHNPRCSKSRAALAIIEAADVEFDIVPYLDDPPTAARLRAVLDALGMKPRELMRRKEAVYRELGLDDEGLGDKALIDAMVANPILIERPIIVLGDRACLGRPPENVAVFLVEDAGLSRGQA